MKKLLLTSAFLSIIIFSHSQFSIQNVVLEMYTGAWSQYSADGTVRFNEVLAANPNVIGISVHTGDAMEVTEATDLATFYSPSYPQATLNRTGTLYSRGTWLSTCSTMTGSASSVTVSFDSVLYNSTTREIDVYLNALFTGPLSGDLRFNCAVVEDSVTGVGSGYDQANADNTTPGHLFFGAGNPIVGFQHRMVARTYLGGTWGTSGIIPGSVLFGTSISHHYNYTLPLNYDEQQIYLVGMVSRFDGPALNDRVILNAERTTLGTIEYVGIENEIDEAQIQIFPNPASNNIQISSPLQGMQKVEMIDQLGKVIFQSELNFVNAEPVNLNIENLIPGTYFIKLGGYSKKLIKI